MAAPAGNVASKRPAAPASGSNVDRGRKPRKGDCPCHPGPCSCHEVIACSCHEAPARCEHGRCDRATPAAGRRGGGGRRNIAFGRPMIGAEERAAVARVLDGPTLTHGPLVREFERAFAAFCGAPHAVATSSCATALHLGALALGLGPGDEVIVSAQTHVATAHAIELCGARCVFADSELATGNVDPAAIEAAITPRTAAIALVHYLGVPADMPRIMAIARRHKLAVIEDCALSPGATIDGTHTGLLGDVGCFSFYPVKHITTGEGGMLITRRPDIAERVARLRAFGIDRNVISERSLPGMYDVQQLGMNCRMSEISAALGLEQLRKLPGFLEARRRNFARLADGVRGIGRVLGREQGTGSGEQATGSGEQGTGNREPGAALRKAVGVRSACYCLTIVLDEALRPRREQIIRALNARGVGTSIYYPQPVPRMTYYREKYATPAASYAHAALLSDAGIALPVGPHLDEDDMDYIADALRAAVAEVAGPAEVGAC